MDTYYVEIQENLNSEEIGMYLILDEVIADDLEDIKRIFKDFFIVLKLNK